MGDSRKTMTDKVCITDRKDNRKCYCGAGAEEQPSMNWRAYKAARDADTLPENMCQPCVAMVEDDPPWDWEMEDWAGKALKVGKETITDSKKVGAIGVGLLVTGVVLGLLISPFPLLITAGGVMLIFVSRRMRPTRRARDETPTATANDEDGADDGGEDAGG